MSRDVLKGVLAGGVPLLIYLSTASGYAHWLDSGEFVAVATDFGVSHPPGHPLASVVLGFANVLPAGSLSLRVAWICAALVAVGAGALFFAIARTLRATGAVAPSLITPLSLAATWWVALSHAWWFQAVRPEVYALQVALLSLAYERLIRVATAEPTEDIRPLYHAALAIGLALSNHHYIALIAIVPTGWLLVNVIGRAGWRPIGWAGLFGGAGLLTYWMLPLRALAGPYLNLGDPSTPSRFFWVVSAQAFQKSLGPERVAPFSQHLADVLAAMGEDLHVATLLIALLGVYFMLRVRRARRYGLFWLSVWLVFTLGRALLGFVSGNPDALAYFMLAYSAIGAFVAFAIGVLLSAVVEAVRSRPRLGPAVAFVLAVAALGGAWRASGVSSLASFKDTDVFEDGLRRGLPEGAVVLAHNPNTIFRFWGAEAEELNRPDVTLIPLPLTSYPKMVDALVDRDPALTPLLRNYVLTGELNAADLQSLAAERPVFVEMDLRVQPNLYDIVVPEQLYHRVLTADITEADEGQAMRDHEVFWDDLYAQLGAPSDEQTKTQLLWRHYTDALYFGAVGDTEAARRSVARGLAINPHATELVAMREALKEAAPGQRLDVAPFRAE